MIYKNQVAQSVFSNADDNQQPGLFYVGAVMSEGHTPAQGEAAILADLARLRAAPVSAEEMTRAKNQILAQELSERETILGRGVELGESTVVEGDPSAANTAMDKVMAVTPADLQRVVKTYLPADRRVTIAYRAESERPKGEPILSDDAALDAIGTPLASTAVAPPPPAALPTVEPTPTAPPVTAPPVLAERTLKNGLRVIVARTTSAPIVTAELTVKSGAAADTHPGATAMMASLLTEGAAGRSASQIAAEVEAAGGSLGSAANYDSTHVALTVLSKEFAHTLPIMADVVERPTLANEELERKRTQKLDALQVTLKQPGGVASFITPSAVFGTGLYGRTVGGTPSSVKGLTRADVTTSYARAFQPSKAILVITGDIAPEPTPSPWRKRTSAPGHRARRRAKPSRRAAPAAPSVTVVDLPGSGQAAVVVVAPTIARERPGLLQGRSGQRRARRRVFGAVERRGAGQARSVLRL